MIKKYPYESCFAEIVIKPLVSEDKDKCLALASLEEIKSFLPNIDINANLDLLPVAFNACVVNRVNKNRDVVDTATALAMTKYFIHKPINVEHNRQKVIGMILTAGFSEFGTDRPLTEEQVKGMTSPFNVTLGGVVWRVVCPELADHIEDSNDPTSDKYLSVSASWELGFTDYRVALLEGGAKNLAEARIISDPAEIDKVRDKLTSLGGDGKVEELFAYRMPSYDVLPLGIGFTEKPAAEVKGIATPSKEQANLTNPEAFHNEPRKVEEPEVTIPKPTKEGKTVNLPNKETFGTSDNQNKISQSVNSDVKIERKVTMKITSIQDISEASIKDVAPSAVASAVSEFIAAELTKGSGEWEKQKNALNTQLAQAQADGEKLKTEQTKLQDQLKQVQATVDALSAEKSEREKVEKFNVRMSSINEEYELDDEVRAALVEDIKAIASDEDFEKWKSKAKVLLKGFAKKKKNDISDKPGADKEDLNPKYKGNKCKGDGDGDGDAAAAAAAAAAAVANAIDNADKDKGGLPNGSSANSPTLKEKYQAAFAVENFVITK